MPPYTYPCPFRARARRPRHHARSLKGTLDAFFFTGGVPAKAISELATSPAGIRLLPIDGAAAERLRADSAFLVSDTIDAAAYPGVDATPTLAVGAQWITDERIPVDLIYQLTRSLFSDATQKALATGHPQGASITLPNAVRGAGIPFHEGALRFYREARVLK